MSSYPQLKQFMTLLHQFHTIDRVAQVPTLERKTNAVEHSYQLAMLAWYVVSAYKLNLNYEKVFKYALAHDIVEAYAGDTFIYDEEAKKTKLAREAAALVQIETHFPEFPELASVTAQYDTKEDAESRFVYALDKFIDPLNSVMTKEKMSVWKEYGMTYEDHFAYKDSKIALSPEVVPLWEALSKELTDNKDFFFPA